MLIFFLYSLLTAVVAFVYSELLTREGNIFGVLYNVLDKHLPDWLFKPIMKCALCVSGQFALWTFPFFFAYNVFFHIAYISLTILFTKIIYDRCS